MSTAQKVTFYGEMNRLSMALLVAQLRSLRADGAEKIHLEINSAGGLFASFLDNAKDVADMVSTTYAGEDIVGSAAVPLYMMADRRIAYRESRFFFHHATKEVEEGLGSVNSLILSDLIIDDLKTHGWTLSKHGQFLLEHRNELEEIDIRYAWFIAQRAGLLEGDPNGHQVIIRLMNHHSTISGREAFDIGLVTEYVETEFDEDGYPESAKVFTRHPDGNITEDDIEFTDVEE